MHEFITKISAEKAPVSNRGMNQRNKVKGWLGGDEEAKIIKAFQPY